MMFHRNRLRIFLLAYALLGMAFVASPVAHATTITVINNDGPSEGFNDPTPVPPVGGNTGTTLGAQRLIAMQYAANIWAGLVSSTVPIRVRTQFDPFACDSFFLGFAGTVEKHRDFSGAPVAGTWYPVALANALHGSDLSPDVDDITATFNSSFQCAPSDIWYYGLDASPPGGKVDFVSVAVHELGHGLGFMTVVNLLTGAKLNGFNDTFMRNLENHGATPPDYPSMTDAQRLAASTNTGNLHWVGANVKAASGVLTAGKVDDHVQMFAPNPQRLGSSVSHWDEVLTPGQVMRPSGAGGPRHFLGLELPLMQDIGWTLLATSPPVASSPVISVTPSSQDFGNVTVGTYAPRTFVVQNTGGGTLTGTASTSAPFSITGLASYSLAAGVNTTVFVRFSPPSAATFTGNITFTGGGGTTRTVTGTGVVAAITPPGAPTSVSAIPGNGSITVNFGAPASNGGAAITGYSATCTSSNGGVPGSNPGGASATSILVGGLTNGRIYTCTVTASNSAGPGLASAVSNSVTPLAPVTVPGAPTAVSATPHPGTGSITVNFGAPASNGGAAITGYSAACKSPNGGVPGSNPGGASVTSILVGGLTNGKSYICAVRASNSVGPSVFSAPSNPVVLSATTPGAPTAVSATPGNASITVNFGPPASNGGAAIIGYSATCTSSNGGVPGSNTGGASATSILVGGLTNFRFYTCTVTALNPVGPGPASAPSNAVRPSPIPTLPFPKK